MPLTAGCIYLLEPFGRNPNTDVEISDLHVDELIANRDIPAERNNCKSHKCGHQKHGWSQKKVELETVVLVLSGKMGVVARPCPGAVWLNSGLNRDTHTKPTSTRVETLA